MDQGTDELKAFNRARVDSSGITLTWGEATDRPDGVAVFQGDGAAAAAAMCGAAPRMFAFMREIVEAAKWSEDPAKVLAQIGMYAELFIVGHDHLSAQHGTSLADAGAEDRCVAIPAMSMAERAARTLGIAVPTVH